MFVDVCVWVCVCELICVFVCVGLFVNVYVCVGVCVCGCLCVFVCSVCVLGGGAAVLTQSVERLARVCIVWHSNLVGARFHTIQNNSAS